MAGRGIAKSKATSKGSGRKQAQRVRDSYNSLAAEDKAQATSEKLLAIAILANEQPDASVDAIREEIHAHTIADVLRRVSSVDIDKEKAQRIAPVVMVRSKAVKVVASALKREHVSADGKLAAITLLRDAVADAGTLPVVERLAALIRSLPSEHESAEGTQPALYNGRRGVPVKVLVEKARTFAAFVKSADRVIDYERVTAPVDSLEDVMQRVQYADKVTGVVPDALTFVHTVDAMQRYTPAQQRAASWFLTGDADAMANSRRKDVRNALRMARRYEYGEQPVSAEAYANVCAVMGVVPSTLIDATEESGREHVEDARVYAYPMPEQADDVTGYLGRNRRMNIDALSLVERADTIERRIGTTGAAIGDDVALLVTSARRDVIEADNESTRGALRDAMAIAQSAILDNEHKSTARKREHDANAEHEPTAIVRESTQSMTTSVRLADSHKRRVDAARMYLDAVDKINREIDAATGDADAVQAATSRRRKAQRNAGEIINAMLRTYPMASGNSERALLDSIEECITRRAADAVEAHKVSIPRTFTVADAVDATNNRADKAGRKVADAVAASAAFGAVSALPRTGSVDAAIRKAGAVGASAGMAASVDAATRTRKNGATIEAAARHGSDIGAEAGRATMRAALLIEWHKRDA